VVSVLVVLAVVAVIGYYAYVKLVRDATSPSELVGRFDEAGVTCARQKSLDLGETKALWCATSDGTAITTTTYSGGVDYAQWLSTHCAVAGNRGSRGAVVVSDGWTIDVRRLVNGRPSAARVADRLSGVLGGEVRLYRCAATR
jgi:hypothetical protein